jgi:hypothetical protein
MDDTTSLPPTRRYGTDTDTEIVPPPSPPPPPPKSKKPPVEERTWTKAYADWRAKQADPSAYRRNRPQRPPEIQTRNDLFSDAGNKLCGARTRIPGLYGDWICHKAAIVNGNGRCKLHGGLSPVGIPKDAGVGSRRGRHVRLLAQMDLLELYDEYKRDAELTELSTEIALADVEIAHLMKRAHNPKATEQTRKELREWIAERRKLVETVKRNRHAMVPTAQVLAFMHAMVNLTFKYVKDARARANLLNDIRKLSGRYSDGVEVPKVAPIVDVSPEEMLADGARAVEPTDVVDVAADIPAEAPLAVVSEDASE